MAITKVEYYSNGQLIGTRTSEPFDVFDHTFTGIGTTAEITAKLWVDGVLVQTTQPRTLSIVEKPDLDPDYLAVINYATANSIPLPTAEQQAIDSQFLIDYKATGAWDRDDIVAKFNGTADPLFKLIDWKRLVQMTTQGTLYWTNDGVKTDGSTGVIWSGYDPSTQGINYKLDNAGLVMVDNTASYVSSTTYTFYSGRYDGTSYALFPGGNNTYKYNYINGPYLDGVSRITGAFNPKAGANGWYRDGNTLTYKLNTEHTGTQAPSRIANGELPLLCVYNASAGTLNYNVTHNVQFMSIGGSKNDIHSTMETVLNTL